MKFIGDFHIHTVASGDAFGTIREIVSISQEKNLNVIAITDHGPAMPSSSHCNYFNSLADNVRSDSGIIIYPGVEANIIDKNGRLDLPDNTLNRLEYIIAAFHGFSWDNNDVYTNTVALKACLMRYNIKSIAHLNYPYFAIDMTQIVPVLIDKKIAIEINNKALEKDSDWSIFKNTVLKLRYKGVKFIVNSDAHYPLQVGDFTRAVEFIDYCGLKESDIINTSLANVFDYLGLRSEE